MHCSDELLAARGLPPIAFVESPYDKGASEPRVIAVKRGENAYHPVVTALTADELIAQHGVSPEQRQAMHFGSLFGWHVPAADPKHPMWAARTQAA